MKTIQKWTTGIRIFIALIPITCYVLLSCNIWDNTALLVIAGIFTSILAVIDYLPLFSKSNEINNYETRSAILIAEIEHAFSLYTNDMLSDEYIKNIALDLRKQEASLPTESFKLFYKPKKKIQVEATKLLQQELLSHNIDKNIIELQNSVYGGSKNG